MSLKDKFEEGYYSDGDTGPLFDAIEIEGEQDFEEDEISEVESSTDSEVSSSSDVQPSPPPLITIEDIKKTKIPELKEELKKRNLALSGNKPVLSKRLEEAIWNKVPVRTADTTKASKPKKDTSEIRGFCEGAHWKELNPEADAVTEPNNASFRAPRAPTILEHDVQYVPVKHNFNHIFDCPVLCGKIDNVLTYKGGKPLTETKTRERGCIDPSFAKKHKLSTESFPSNFMSVFLPLQDNPYSTPKKNSQVFRCWQDGQI